MAGVIGRAGNVVKPAARILASDKFSPGSLTELRAGVGSVELLGGDRRRSKRLLQASLEDPNDNALAQIEWALSLDRMFDVDVGSFDVSRNYEALALEAYNQQNWSSVIRHCESWLMDMPFASRPVMMASHVATLVLDEPGAAVLFCQAGRLATPRDPQLVNNSAYALALDGRPEDALEVLDEIPLSTVEDERAKVYLTATRGLVSFRLGRIPEGRLFYAAAIEAANHVEEPSFRQLAILNYAREELLVKQPLPQSMIDGIRSLKIDSRAAPTQIFRDRVVALIDAASAKSATTG